MKTICILKDRLINNKLDAIRNYDYLFSLSCPSSFKTFKLDGKIQVLSNGIFQQTIDITPKTFIGIIYPDMRLSDNPDSIAKFEFSIGKESLINTTFDNASTILIFGKFDQNIKGLPLYAEICIDSVQVQISEENGL